MSKFANLVVSVSVAISSIGFSIASYAGIDLVHTQAQVRLANDASLGLMQDFTTDNTTAIGTIGIPAVTKMDNADVPFFPYNSFVMDPFDDKNRNSLITYRMADYKPVVNLEKHYDEAAESIAFALLFTTDENPQWAGAIVMWPDEARLYYAPEAMPNFNMFSRVEGDLSTLVVFSRLSFHRFDDKHLAQMIAKSAESTDLAKAMYALENRSEFTDEEVTELVTSVGDVDAAEAELLANAENFEEVAEEVTSEALQDYFNQEVAGQILRADNFSKEAQKSIGKVVDAFQLD